MIRDSNMIRLCSCVLFSKTMIDNICFRMTDPYDAFKILMAEVEKHYHFVYDKYTEAEAANNDIARARAPVDGDDQQKL